MSLEEAQKAKHEFIANSLNIKKDSKALDLGCGWGPFLHFVQKKGASGMGLTLSEGQAEACRKNGMQVWVKDCRFIKPEDFGIINAVTSLGVSEHFCSVEDWKAGKQEKIYQKFFYSVHSVLPT